MGAYPPLSWPIKKGTPSPGSLKVSSARGGSALKLSLEPVYYRDQRIVKVLLSPLTFRVPILEESGK